MRQRAWLDVAPRNDKGKAGLSRLEMIRRDQRNPAYEPEMPEVSACGHLIGYLFDAGPFEQGGMGPAPLSWKEINAWCDRTGIDLQPWESRMLRVLSSAYTGEMNAAEDQKRVSPCGAESGPARAYLTALMRADINATAEL